MNSTLVLEERAGISSDVHLKVESVFSTAKAPPICGHGPGNGG
jgi:hypothetical protein